MIVEVIIKTLNVLNNYDNNNNTRTKRSIIIIMSKRFVTINVYDL